MSPILSLCLLTVLHLASSQQQQQQQPNGALSMTFPVSLNNVASSAQIDQLLSALQRLQTSVSGSSDNSELLSRLTQLAENLNRTDQASETFKPKLWVDGQSFLYPFVIVPYFFHSFFLAFLFFPLSPFSVH